MRQAVCALICVVAIAPIVAAELSTLASGAAQGPLEALEKTYREHGMTVQLQFDTSPNISKRLASGEVPDVLIALAPTVDQLIKEGKAVASTRAAIGKMGIGVGTGRGSRRPDISTLDALRTSLQQADSVLLTQGAAGVYLEKVLLDLGVMDQISGKVTRMPTGESLTQRLGNGRGNQIGFTMISELKLGARYGASYVGPIPAGIQMLSSYEAVVMSASPARDEARGFVRFITTPAARKLFAADGWQF